MDSHNSNKSAILKTILYEDIFDYPLSTKEIWKYLHSDTEVSQKDVISSLKKLKNDVQSWSGFYFLKGNKDIAKERKRLAFFNREKMRQARLAAALLAKIPSILLIGVSGSVAMQSAKKGDDIDLFIVTSRNTLWITRLVATLLLDRKNLRRKRKDTDVRDKVCLNMLVSEDGLMFPKTKQNIYIAHEITQLHILLDKNNMHAKLLADNAWIKNYLANIYLPRAKQGTFTLWNLLFSPFEAIVRTMQKSYMKRYANKEILTNQVVAFHPFSYEHGIIRKYKARIKAYGLSI